MILLAIKSPRMNNIIDFVDRFIDNAFAAIKLFGPENIRYINFALEIPLCVIAYQIQV